MQPLELEEDPGVPVSSREHWFSDDIDGKEMQKIVVTLFCLLTKDFEFAKPELKWLSSMSLKEARRLTNFMFDCAMNIIRRCVYDLYNGSAAAAL